MDRPARCGWPCLRAVGILLLWAGVSFAAVRDPGRRCLVASGDAASRCVAQAIAALGTCRNAADAACEQALGAPGGTLEQLRAAAEAPVRRNCTPEAADKLTFLLGLDDLVARTKEACQKWSADFLAVAYAPDLATRPPEAMSCQREVGTRLARLQALAVEAYGRRCYVREFGGHRCDRKGRDRRVARARAVAEARIAKTCGATFDTLGIVAQAASPTLAGRIAALAEIAIGRARHLAQRVYPPLNLGPTGLFGSAPVGVRTLDLVDPSRLNVAGTGPRPLKVTIYYPSTPAAVAGVQRDAPFIFPTPTYRGVVRAPGRFPLVLLSPGFGTTQWAYVFLAAHLASHGIVVASIDRHSGVAVNAPLDLSAMLDQILAFDGAPDDFLGGAIDSSRIGAAGHSFGGFAAMALATCPFSLGTFTDPRIKAILSLEGAVQWFTTAFPGVVSTITVPTLLLGGASSFVAAEFQPTFDALTPGPAVMGYANLRDGYHGTFEDLCELSDAVLDASFGGASPECVPGALPWRYARHITNYLAFNFFDATLNGNAEALARLDPALLAAKSEDVTYQRKQGDCAPGASCNLTCEEAVCGDATVGPREACDPPGEQGVCAPGETCNSSCTACVTCAGATVIGGDGGVVAGTTVGGTNVLESGCVDEAAYGDGFAPERLFQWTPNVSHMATIETCGGTTNFDTTLYVREGSCMGAQLACNDQACGDQSRVTLPVVAGTTYFIVVDGFIGAAGNFTLSVQ